MIPRTPSRHRAFTLIELLAVIAIIGIMSALTFGLYGFVRTSRLEAKARGEIAVLRTKLEEFKGRYGEYPMAEGASAEAWQRALFDALTGKRGYTRSIDEATGRTRLAWTTEIREADRKPLVSVNDIGTDRSFAEAAVAATYFADPWGNPYQYRYGVLSSGRVSRTWDNPSYLLISAGAKFTEPFVPATECFADSMETTGTVPETYFEDATGKRNDNLTNFGDK